MCTTPPYFLSLPAPAGQQATSTELKSFAERKSTTCSKLRAGKAALMIPIFI